MKRFLAAIAAFLVLVFALVWFRQSGHGASDKARAREDAVPVTLTTAKSADVPLWLDGIGTVQALNTVNIRAQVDGQLIEVRFREGQDVAQGDVLARIDPRLYQASYDKAVARLAQDQANLENARRDMLRYQKLARTQYTSAQQADQQASTVAQLEAQVSSDRADIASAKVNLEHTTITAPFAGRVGVRQVDPGNIVHAADTSALAVLTTLRPIDVIFTLPQQLLPEIAAVMAQGQPSVIALPQNGETGEALGEGRVTVLDNQVEQSTGTIKLKAEFANDSLKLWPGAFVNVRVKLRTDRGVTTVPAVSVQRGPDGAFVYVVDADSKAERRRVVVARQDQEIAVITSGLKPGKSLVLEGASRVTAGRKLRPVDAINYDEGEAGG